MRYYSIQNAATIHQRKFYWLMSGGITISWLWVLYNLQYKQSNGFSPCLFSNAVGLPCPSCGTTRGIVAILQGDLYAVSQFNALSYVAVIALVVFPIWLIADLVRNRPTIHNAYVALEHFGKRRPAFWFIILTLIAANWIWILCNQNL